MEDVFRYLLENETAWEKHLVEEALEGTPSRHKWNPLEEIWVQVESCRNKVFIIRSHVYTPEKGRALLRDAAERPVLDTTTGIAQASYGTSIRPSGELLLRR